MQESNLGRIGWRGWLMAWWLCALLCGGGARAEPLVLDTLGATQPRGAQVQVLEDAGGSWTLAQVQAAARAGAWRPLASGQPSGDKKFVEARTEQAMQFAFDLRQAGAQARHLTPQSRR